MIRDAVQIKRVLRRMRGGSQSHLVEGDDGHFYVAKFLGNPQGNRTLINEWVGDCLLRKLGACTPAMRILRLSEATQNTFKDTLCFSVGNRKIPVEAGLHLGSQCPVDPGQKVILDFLPRNTLHCAVNLEDFAKAFVADHIVGHTDSRQAIFVREIGAKLKLRAYLIDHGMMFGGCEWVVRDLPRHGLCLDPTIYSMLDMRSCCEQALDLLSTWPDDNLTATVNELPKEWFSPGDAEDLFKLFMHLHAERTRRCALIMRHLETLPSVPKYKEAKSLEFELAYDLAVPATDARRILHRAEPLSA
jgi:hypothetical protein